MEDVDKFDEINIKFIIPADDMDNYGEIMAEEIHSYNIYKTDADVSPGSCRTKVILMPIFSTRGADVSQVMKVKFRENFKKTSLKQDFRKRAGLWHT